MNTLLKERRILGFPTASTIITGIGLSRPSREKYLALIFVLPTILALITFTGWPMIYSLFLSLNKVTINAGKFEYSDFGVGNYLNLIKDSVFREALVRTVGFSGLLVTGTMVASLAIALILNQSGIGAKIARFLFLIPWAVPYTVNAVMWGWIYHGSYGLLNEILYRIGAISEYRTWLANPKEAMILIIIASIWKAVPISALMILAGLKAIPRELIDAAKVDGAGSLQTLRYITLPTIKPVLIVTLILETMWSLKSFDMIWILTKGGPMNQTTILNIFAFKQAFQFFNFGYGSAASYVITAITFALTFIYYRRITEFE